MPIDDLIKVATIEDLHNRVVVNVVTCPYCDTGHYVRASYSELLCVAALREHCLFEHRQQYMDELATADISSNNVEEECGQPGYITRAEYAFLYVHTIRHSVTKEAYMTMHDIVRVSL